MDNIELLDYLGNEMLTVSEAMQKIDKIIEIV